MSRWFRMYDEILDDPRVQKLPPELYRTWVNSLALCSRNGGRLPPIADCSFAFRETEESVSSAFHALEVAGLFVTVDETFQPRNWRKRQYKSDTSTDRVRTFRKRSRNVTETAPDTDTETDRTLAKANGASAGSDEVFWANAKAYLQSVSRNPGALIGKWVRDNGRDATAAALTRAQLERPVEKIPFIEGCFKKVRAQPAVPL